MGPAAKPANVRFGQAGAFLLGALALEALIERGSAPFYWTPLIIGLSYLAERWNLKRERQAPIQVEIVEASPQRVVVKNVDFSSGLDHGHRKALVAPVAERLTRT